MQLRLNSSPVVTFDGLTVSKYTKFTGYGVSFYVLEADLQALGSQVVLERLKQAFCEDGSESSLHNLEVIEREIG